MGLEAKGKKERITGITSRKSEMVCSSMVKKTLLFFFSHYFIILFVSTLRIYNQPDHESGIAAIASISIKKAPGNFPTSTAVRAGLGDGSMALYTPFMAV
jgi:hypothetical protein